MQTVWVGKLLLKISAFEWRYLGSTGLQKFGQIQRSQQILVQKYQRTKNLLHKADWAMHRKVYRIQQGMEDGCEENTFEDLEINWIGYSNFER